MRIADLDFIEFIEIAIEPVVADGFAGVRSGEEILVHPASGDLVTLVQDTTRAIARPIGRQATRALSELPLGDRRIVSLAAGDETRGMLRVWGFGRGFRFGEEQICVGLGANAAEGIAERLGGVVDAHNGTAWFADEFLLPAQGDGQRAIARVGSSSGGLGRSFSLCGANLELDIVDLGGRLEAQRLAPRRQFNSALGTVLVEAQWSIATGEASDAAPNTLSLGRLLEDTEYLHRWARYNDAEHQLELDRAAELGECDYNAVTAREGAWRFQLTGSPGVFIDEVGEDEGLTAKERSAGPTPGRAFVGEVLRGNRADGTLDLRPVTADVAPPQRGVLSFAVAGSTAVHDRREEASRRLATGAVPIPDLGSLLEMQPTSPRLPGRRMGWDSPAARAVFGAAEPTDAQKRAIEIALNTPDVAVIQGPPGTGKTKVITAIAVRIAEELGDTAASRQILLASQGHDAVDNVAARTAVFGLPSIKEGLGQHRGSWLASWRRERLDQAAQLFQGVEHGEAMALRTWVAERRDGYILSPRDQSSTADMLDDVLTRCRNQLPAPLELQIMTKGAELRSERSNLKGKTQLERAIRAFRTDPKGFADDGPQNARALMVRLEQSKNARSADLALLDRAGASDPPVDGLLADLAALKDRLLDEHVVEAVRSLTPQLNEEVARILTAVVDALDVRINADGQGMAVVLARFVHDLETDRLGVENALAGYAAVVASTCNAAASLAARPGAVDGKAEFNTVIIDEAARANPLDLQIPMTLASRRVVLVGDQRQLPHIVDEEVAQSLTVTEAEAVELQESLFGRLFRHLEDERRCGRPDRVVTLNHQFRMHPTLGRFVSEQFYEPFGAAIESPLGPEHFGHTLSGYSGRCAAWHDIPRRDGREEKYGQSRRRLVEATWIANEIRRLLEEAPQLTLGVITFYRAQVDLLFEALAAVGLADQDPERGKPAINHVWQYTTAASGDLVERLRVGTVDAFQGKEFDVVLLSAVRTPGDRRGTPNGLFGHLVIPNRLCVAMSRQRRLLVAVGDRHGLTEHPLAGTHLGPLQEFARLCDAEEAP